MFNGCSNVTCIPYDYFIYAQYVCKAYETVSYVFYCVKL